MIAQRSPSVPPRPANEADRLRALRSLQLLDTAPEERFDRIVRLSAKILEAPISYIALIDEERQWFKARDGMACTGSSRDESFCGHTILENEPLIIEDARTDPRFSANPMVTGPAGVRFYAGVPLRSDDGLNVATLCIMDTRPRRLSPHQRSILLDLAAIAEHELRLVGLVVLQDRLLESQRDLAEEKRKSDNLLRNILPDRIAEELKAHGRVQPALHPRVAALFADFTDFTRISRTLEPAELLHELNECFSAFDAITVRHGVEKLKTMGDGYLCVSGLCTGEDDHAERLLETAFEMRDFIARRRRGAESGGRDHWDVRIGIHAGPAVSGVVGVRKFAFDLWGDTINTASRLESGGEAGRINVSGDFLGVLRRPVESEARGSLPVKGVGAVDQHFVLAWAAA